MALNTYMAKGYLVKAPVVTSYLKKDEQHLMARFTLAVNGNTKDSVDYIPFTCFQEKTVEFMQKHCTVGTQLLVQATLHNYHLKDIIQTACCNVNDYILLLL